jgi:hypothetical protein
MFAIGCLVGAVVATIVCLIVFKLVKLHTTGTLHFVEDDVYVIGLDNPDDVHTKNQILLKISHK